MKVALVLFALVCPLAVQAQIVSETFDTTEALGRWENASAGALDDGALKIQRSERGDTLVSLPLPAAALRGRRVEITGRVRFENVRKAPQEWHGVKVMLQAETPGGADYQSPPKLAGSSGWREIGLTAAVPADATAVALRLGLGEASGAAWFDDIAVRVVAEPRVVPAERPALSPPDRLDRRTAAPRLRGVMYGPHFREEDIRMLAAWRANLIRWQFYYHGATDPKQRGDLAAYDRWLEQTMAEVDRALPLCQELGIAVVIDLHTPPGGLEGHQMALFSDAACQEKFISVWDRLAAHYRNAPAVWGYDLLNEPAEGRLGAGLLDWRALAEKVARRVRAIDPDRAIIVEPGAHGGWSNLPFFPPLDVPGVVYSVHMYEPMAFTHQGVLDGLPAGIAYPGTIGGEHWDRETLRRKLQPVRDYQRDYNIPIYIGEFSVPRWAPGASGANWLRDCISLFEEYGWDWSYHSFREWHGWNVELGNDPQVMAPPASPSDRQQVLRAQFSRNEAP